VISNDIKYYTRKSEIIQHKPSSFLSWLKFGRQLFDFRIRIMYNYVWGVITRGMERAKQMFGDCPLFKCVAFP